MKTLSDLTALAYAAGKRAGYTSIEKQEHSTRNPYSEKDALCAYWAAGFNDGIDQAMDEEN